MNIEDMAKKAGVSVATISRAVNPATRALVAPATLEQVDRLVERYNYSPNAAAKNLRASFYGTIGVIVPHVSGLFYLDYYQHILAGVSDAVLESRFRFKLLILKAGMRWDRYDFKSAEGIDGLIITYWPYYFSDAKFFSRLGLPCAVIGDPIEGVPVFFANGDSRSGGDIAANFLHSRGHRHVAVLTGPSWWSESRLRLSGFLSIYRPGVRGHRVTVADCNFEEEKGFEAAGSILKKDRSVTAFFCLNDEMAFGAIRKLRELKIRCPEDISVIGYDNSGRSVHFDPPLTTVHVPVHELALEAASSLTRHLSDPVKPRSFTGNKLLPVTLKVRDSATAVR